MTVATAATSTSSTHSAPETAEYLLKAGDQRLYEVVDGVVLEKQMSSLAGKTTIAISSRLYAFVEANGLGDLYSEVSFQCFANLPGRTRRPDIAFVSADRVDEVPPDGYVPVRPDLAIEVVSPNDLLIELNRKLIDYRSAGIPLVWVVHPELRIIQVHRLGRPMAELTDTDTLGGDDIIPGFSATVGDLIPKSKRTVRTR